jgi:hypothetical protein
MTQSPGRSSTLAGDEPSQAQPPAHAATADVSPEVSRVLRGEPGLPHVARADPHGGDALPLPYAYLTKVRTGTLPGRPADAEAVRLHLKP